MTSAPATTAPLRSLTLPKMLADVTCARSTALVMTQTPINSSNILTNFLIQPPEAELGRSSPYGCDRPIRRIGLGRSENSVNVNETLLPVYAKSPRKGTACVATLEFCGEPLR